MSPSPHRRRVAAIVVGFTLVALAIGVRLYQLQVVRYDSYTALGAGQHTGQVAVHPPRGRILDRLGRELAVSLETQSLFAHPARAKDPARAARLMAPVLGRPEREIASALSSEKPFVYLRRFLEPERVEQLLALELAFGDAEALGFETQSKRYYPRGALAGHVIGFANIDGDGLEGVEHRFDEQLRGDPSIYLVTKDARHGRVRRLVREPEAAPQDVVLTLDATIQHTAERELQAAMGQTGAAAGSVIVMDPSTGQILALANRPTFDLNAFSRASGAQKANRAVTHLYEPGSTFKIVTAAALLEHDAVTPGQTVFCENGAWRLGRRLIRDTKPHGSLSLRQVLVHSSNIGIAKLVERLDRRALWQTIHDFGFGQPTGLGLPGEQAGLFRPVERWTGHSGPSLAFGHEIGVTSLQMASAFATIANDGIRARPQIVLGLADASGQLRRTPGGNAQRVLSRETARRVGSMMRDVVDHGTGTGARVAGYVMAGKTGTAQKVVGGAYSETDYVASFGGFGPAERPRLVVLVTLDSPRGPLHQGGRVAAPVFSRIMDDALRYLRVPADGPPNLRAGRPRGGAAPRGQGEPG